MLPFSAAMREREAQLRRAVVAVVVGAARTPSAAQVHDELCSEFSLSPHSFSVRRFFPEDFLVTFQCCAPPLHPSRSVPSLGRALVEAAACEGGVDAFPGAAAPGRDPRSRLG